MDLDSFINYEKTSNVDVPSAYMGLKILLVDHDTTSISNIAAILQEHSFKVTAIEQATVALSILLEQIDQFDLVMVDVNMPEMDYLEFIKSTQLIQDKPIILVSPEVTMEMVKVAWAQGACFIFKKSAISSMKLKNIWQHMYLHIKKSNRSSQHSMANQVGVMDNTSCAKKLQDKKGKSIVNCSETYQDQVVCSLIKKDEVERSMRNRITNEETQIKSRGSSEKQEDHSLLSKTRTETPQKKRQRMQWTPDFDKKLAEVVHELGEKVTAIEQATVALSILLEQIDQFDLVMVDVNMPKMDYLEFIKSTQLIQDKPIILMSPEVTMEMVKVAWAQGACFIFKKSSISSMKLKNIWQHVYLHNKKSNRSSQHSMANQVGVMDNTSCAKKLQDKKGQSIVNCSETYQDQVVCSLIKKDEVERSKRKRITNEETQIKSSGSSEKQENHSLLSKRRTETQQKKRQRMQWTPNFDNKLAEVVHELGEKAHPRNFFKRMCVQDLTKQHLTYRLKKYRSQKLQAPSVQPATSMNFNEEHHSNVSDSNDFSTNFNELFQGAYIPQPSKVPFIASPSSNDHSLHGWNDWNELLELDNFNAELMPENQSNRSYNLLDYVPVCGSSTQNNVSTRKR